MAINSMREIRIQVWDKEKKTMSVGMSLEMLAGFLTAIYPNLGNEIYRQFTGFHDKNGKEIYEGDIVRKLGDDWASKSSDDPRSLDEYLLAISEVWEIVYHTDSFTLRRQTGGYNPWSTDNEGFTYSEVRGGKHGWIEVIGNIYENPDLLK